MTGPGGQDTGVGKGKGKSRGDAGGSAARPAGETTPRPGQQSEPRLTHSAGGGPMALRAARLAGLYCSGPVEAPRRGTICAFAVLVAVLALLRSFFLPVSPVLCESKLSYFQNAGKIFGRLVVRAVRVLRAVRRTS